MNNQKIVIIGAGIAGLMSAYFLRRRLPHAKITVLEKGTYVPNPFGTSSRSAACSRQTFGCKHNVELSLFSTRFYERFQHLFGEKMTVFRQRGYLWLYRSKQKWEYAQQCAANQLSWGLPDVEILSREEIHKRFPFQVSDDVVGATFCQTDGFLDPGTILTDLKDWLQDNGVTIQTVIEVCGFSSKIGHISAVELQHGKKIEADYFVNCTGAWASRIGNMIGTYIPVMPEKRYLYTARINGAFSQNDFDRIPMIVCMGDNGLNPYLKPEPGHGDARGMILGCEHPVQPAYNFKDEDQGYVEPQCQANTANGHHLRAWQETVSFVPFANDLGFMDKVNGGFYESTPDHNPIIDFDPIAPNMIHCCGFSGHGIMHGPAAGAAVADLIEHGEIRLFPSAATNLSYRGLIAGTRKTEGMKI